MTRLFIDDIRDPYDDDFVVVRSYDDAVHYMRQHGCPLFISFDHDLGDADERTGYDIAKWMVQKDLNCNGKFISDEFDFHVHSANPVGIGNIIGLFSNYLKVRGTR